MRTRRLVTVFTGLALVAFAPASCKKPDASVVSTQKTKSEPSAPQFDVCGLITKAEVESVIADPLVGSKASGHADNGLRFSQCYYSAQETTKSVSLAIIDRDPAVKTNRGAKEYWEQTFGRFKGGEAAEKDREKETEAEKEKRESLQGQRQEEEEESRPPRKVDGVGDEAFWSGNRVGGALYVLKHDKDVIVRISVGGPDSEDQKIDKCKTLADKVLGHL